MQEHSQSSFAAHPIRQRGWWAFWLGAAFILMFIINQAVLMQMPEKAGWMRGLAIIYGWVMLLCGLLGGILSIVALAKDHERSWMIFVPLLPAAFVLFLVIGEFLFPH
jgi:hypothetical protein